MGIKPGDTSMKDSGQLLEVDVTREKELPVLRF